MWSNLLEISPLFPLVSLSSQVLQQRGPRSGLMCTFLTHKELHWPEWSPVGFSSSGEQSLPLSLLSGSAEGPRWGSSLSGALLTSQCLYIQCGCAQSSSALPSSALPICLWCLNQRGHSG